jgi:predicted RNA-binding Zn-ribbon protein involved in translation (DUF1610 family)
MTTEIGPDDRPDTGHCPTCGPTDIYVDVFLCGTCGQQHALCEKCDRQTDRC